MLEVLGTVPVVVEREKPKIRQSKVLYGIVMQPVEKIHAATSGGKKISKPKILAKTVDRTSPLVSKVVGKSVDMSKTGRAFVAAGTNASIFAVVKRNLHDQANIVRKGLSPMVVVEMSDALAMPRANFLDNLQLPRSTIEARIKKQTALTPAEGDAVLRAAKALARAEEVFEDAATASAWLKREIRSLGGVPPVSLMDTDSGFELVMRTLGRIEQGVVA